MSQPQCNACEQFRLQHGKLWRWSPGRKQAFRAWQKHIEIVHQALKVHNVDDGTWTLK
jgi:hypothetical protein